MSRKQFYFLSLALLIGSFFGFLLGNFSAISHASAAPPEKLLSKTVTLTHFTCDPANFDPDLGSVCLVDEFPTAQPLATGCGISVSTSTYTAVDQCFPSGGDIIAGNFHVIWKNGNLQLMLDGASGSPTTYNYNPPLTVTYFAIY